MIAEELIDTAEMLDVGNGGLSATDESDPTCNRRLAAAGTAQTEGTGAPTGR